MPFEDFEEDKKVNKKKILVFALIALIATASVATAIYKITSSDSEQVIVSEPATLSQPTVNATSAVTGDTIQLITQLSDSAEGLQVFFYENDAEIGFAYTDSTGTAIYNRVNIPVGNYIYHATCMHP